MLLLLLCSFITFWAVNLVGNLFIKTITKTNNLYSFEGFLIGFIFLSVSASYLSILFPLKTISIYVLLIFSCIYLYTNKALLQQWIKTFQWNKDSYFIVILLFFLAACTTIAPRIYDSGLYHIQAIKWAEEYGVVKGLGNLHGRLAFNSSIFNLFAATSMRVVFGQSIYCINFILFSLFIIWLIYKIKFFFKLGNNRFIVLYLLIAISSFWGKIADLSSPSPDLYSTIIPIYIFMVFIESKEKDEQQNYYTYFFLMVLIIFSITVKLAMLPLFIFIPYLLYKIRHQITTKYFVYLFLCCLFVITPWLIRNYILSGYLIYPFPAIDIFNPIWKVPLTDVITEKQMVSSYAWIQKNDINFDKLSFVVKLKTWWFLLSGFRKIIIICILITPLIIIGTYKKRKLTYLKYIDVYIISSICFVFWFILAPDFRFGNAYIIFCAGFLLFIFNTDFIVKYIHQKMLKGYNFFYFGFCSLLVILSTVMLFSFHTLILPAKINRSNFNGKVQMDYYSINNTKIYFPIDDDRCFDETLPCTNYKRDKLKMLGTDIKDGFKTQTN